MKKNWLIRTARNRILGPVSSEKILHFIANGQLKAGDAVCAGNGYWFFINETELVDRYLKNGVEQEFNPANGRPTVLARHDDIIEDDFDDEHTLVVNTTALKDNSNLPDQVLPSEDDLAFPDMDDLDPIDDVDASVQDPIFKAEDVVSKPEVEETHAYQGKLPSESDLEYPDMDDVVKKEEVAVLHVTQSVPPVNATRPRPVKREVVVPETPSDKSDLWLFFVFLVMVFVVLYAIYYYYATVSSSLPQNGEDSEELSYHSIFFDSAMAQEVVQKKNNLLSPEHSSLGHIELLPTPSGISPTLKLYSSKGVNCAEITDFKFIFFYRYASSRERQALRKIISQCRVSKHNRLTFFLNMLDLETPMDRLVMLEAKKNSMLPIDIQEIIKVKQYSTHTEHYALIEVLNDYLKFLFSSPKDYELFRKNEEVLQKIKPFMKESITAKVLDIMVATSSKNKTLKRLAVNRFLDSNVIRGLFVNESNMNISNEDKMAYAEAMKQAFVYIINDDPSDLQNLLLINLATSMYKSDFVTRFVQDIGADISIMKFKKFAFNPTYARRYFLTNFYILQKRTSILEVRKFVRNFLTVDVLKRFGPEILPVVFDYPVTEESKREVVREIIKSNLKSDDPFIKYYVSKLLNEAPYRDLGDRFDIMDERQFFKDLIEEGHITVLSLFNLMKLGEPDSSKLWWLIL